MFWPATENQMPVRMPFLAEMLYSSSGAKLIRKEEGRPTVVGLPAGVSPGVPEKVDLC